MAIVNSKKPKNNILEYLKSIDVTSSNKHEEIEYDNFIGSVVLITTTTSILSNVENEYNVYCIFEDKNTKNIFGNYFANDFKDKIEADKYYIELKNKIALFTDKDILNLIKE